MKRRKVMRTVLGSTVVLLLLFGCAILEAVRAPAGIATLPPALVPTFTPDPCTGWSCTVTGVVGAEATQSGYELEGVTVTLRQTSYCSPTRGEHQATTDGLTGLANHKMFYEVLEKELWRYRRYGGQISLIMVDIDNFKNINDTYGHRAGDKVIKTTSKKIKGCIRQIDTAARYGGDEFAVILPNTQLSDAVIVAERMVGAVSSSPVIWKQHQIPLSISVGVGRYDAATSPEDITRRN